MIRRSAVLLFVTGWLLTALPACLTAPAAPESKTVLQAEVLKVGGQCFPAPETWIATWISSPKQLQEAVSRCNVNRIGTVPEKVPSVDFDRFGVLMVEMGEKRSTGYGFDTGRVTAFMEEEIATVNLVYHEPPTEAITAQMMTAPWILVRMPLGSYNGIRVVDQDGRPLAETDLK